MQRPIVRVIKASGLTALCVVLVAGALGGCSGGAGSEMGQGLGLGLSGSAPTAAERAGKPILVELIEATGPDARGAAGARARFYNTSDKPFRRVDLVVAGYDAKGRVATPVADGDHADKELVRLRYAGVVAPKRAAGDTRWGGVWETDQVTCVEIRRVDIVHTDGSRRRINAREARQLVWRPENARRSCRKA